jgi:ribose 5-phosphate isomerase
MTYSIVAFDKNNNRVDVMRSETDDDVWAAANMLLRIPAVVEVTVFNAGTPEATVKPAARQ